MYYIIAKLEGPGPIISEIRSHMTPDMGKPPLSLSDIFFRKPVLKNGSNFLCSDVFHKKIPNQT